jgi:RNA polymerase sigma factor (sigma-70 family)
MSVRVKPRNDPAKEDQPLRPTTNIAALRRSTNEISGAPITQMTLGHLLEKLPDLDADVHEAVVVNLEAARVRRFVRQLPVLERKVIASRYGLVGDEMSCRQLAETLGISRSNVSAIEQRALDRLRGMYDIPEAA